MGTQIQSEIISDYNKVKPLVKVTYKDKKKMEVDPSNMNFQELGQSFRPSLQKQLDLKHMLEMH
nr:BPK_HP1_G0043930.mRNA.1.CDS.1 [Saccharomyces cerevisiae]